MFTSILRSQSLRDFYLAFLLLGTVMFSTAIQATQSDRDISPLEPGKPVERELAGGQSHSYRIAVTASQYLRVVADQRGIDVVVTLFGPDGKQIVEVDSPNGAQGPEPVSAVAETSGSYRLEVRSLEKDAPVGRYEVKLEELRTSTEQDKTRVAADRAFTQAKLLYEQGTVESLQSAIKKYEGALPLYRALRDRRSESTALHNTGYIYYLLGEKQKALDHYQQALPLLRAIEDRYGEATTLNNVGKVYASLGEMRKALDYYGQALALRRALGDRSGEAMTLGEIGRAYDDLGEKQQFNQTEMIALLKQRRPLVHIASHFSFWPGDEARSFLLLGDGTAFTLSEMKGHSELFAGVQLLTLSACNTAAQQAGANGREIDGFAELAQRLGAAAVIATLWSVADNSTPWIMRDFYQNRQNTSQLTKAAALQQAQIALLKGTAKAKPLPANVKDEARVKVVKVPKGSKPPARDGTRAEVVYVGEADAPPFVRDEKKPFAHPYYWAPFVLIGNWK